MEIASKYVYGGIARKYTAWNEHLDIDDIYGDILLRYVEYPPKTDGEMWMCCKFAAHDWMRRMWGRRGGKTAAIQYAPAYVTDDQGNETPTLDFVPDETVNIDDLVSSKLVRDALPFVLKERELWIASCTLDGWTLGEIGMMLGVTESRVSQILTSRIKPRIQRLLGLLNVEKCDDGGDRTRGSAGAGRLACT